MIKPLNTKIEETQKLKNGFLIRECYYDYPKGKSNIYKIDLSKKIVWYAELPFEDDVYSNSIILKEDYFICSSWKGVTCHISLEDGNITESKLTR